MAHEAGDHDPLVNTLCQVMVYTGCRISEALALTTSSIYLREGVVAIHSLKKRNVYQIRHVPIPDELLVLLDKVHCLQEARVYNQSKRLWPWHRVTAYRIIKNVMKSAKIYGPQACPRGLRHCYGVRAIQKGVPVTTVQEVLGHADLKMTAIYTKTFSKELRQIVSRAW